MLLKVRNYFSSGFVLLRGEGCISNTEIKSDERLKDLIPDVQVKKIVCMFECFISIPLSFIV